MMKLNVLLAVQFVLLCSLPVKADFWSTGNMYYAAATGATMWDDAGPNPFALTEVDAETKYQLTFHVLTENVNANIQLRVASTESTDWATFNSNAWGAVSGGKTILTIGGYARDIQMYGKDNTDLDFTPAEAGWYVLEISDVNWTDKTAKVKVSKIADEYTDGDPAVYDNNELYFYGPTYDNNTVWTTHKFTYSSATGSFVTEEFRVGTAAIEYLITNASPSVYYRAWPEAALGWWTDTANKDFVTDGNNGRFTGLTAGDYYRAELRFNSNMKGGQVRIVFVRDGGDEPGPEQAIYFYGDMNMWSIYENNAGMQQSIKNSSDVDVSADVWGSDIPFYLTKEELDRDWRLHRIEGAPEGQTADGGDWYMLDFSDKVDKDGHRGRLCGQFKLTDGNWNRVHWGCSSTDDYLTSEKSIHANEPFVADKATGHRNLHMYHSYIDGAKLYFQPATGTVLVTGEGKDIYVYYVGPDDMSADFHPYKRIFDMSQVNYYTDNNTFNTGDWETVTGPVTAPNGVTYSSNVLRMKIPYGAEHRDPIEFNVTIGKHNGTYFPATRIKCEDLWFIERSVYVYFRYEDESIQPEEVGYTAFYEDFDSELGYVTGYTYATGDADKYIKMEPGQPTADADIDIVGEHTWFRSPVELPADFISGAWALFRTSQGATYPVGGVKASSRELAKAAIQGANLYYTVPAASNPGILYSHHKGTYQVGTDHAGIPLQINAQLFDENGELDNSCGEVRYSFSVARGGETVFSQDAGEKPYMDIAAGALTAGYYFVTVNAVKGGVTNVATDVFPVYPAAVTTNDVVRKAADEDSSSEPEYMTVTDGEIPAGEPAEAFYMSAFSTSGNEISVQANKTAVQSWVKFSDKASNPDEAGLGTNATASHKCENYASAYYRSYAEAGDAVIARTTSVATTITGVEDISVSPEAGRSDDSPVEYYNLQGMRVAEPSKGLYIRVQGKTSTKVYVR